MSSILDASVAVAWAFADVSFRTARPALDSCQASYATSPSLLLFEVASALRKATLDGRLREPELAQFLGLLNSLDIRLDATPPPTLTLLALATQYSLSTYDATYLELAIRRALPLATLDHDLAQAAHQAGVPLLLSI